MTATTRRRIGTAPAVTAGAATPAAPARSKRRSGKLSAGSMGVSDCALLESAFTRKPLAPGWAKMFTCVTDSPGRFPP